MAEETKIEKTLVEYFGDAINSVKKYLDGDSRKLGYYNPNDGARYINIPTPAWYPDSFLRSLKNSFYLKMINNTKYLNNNDNLNSTKLEFYDVNNKSDGSIKGMLKSAVKSLVSVGINQVRSITSKIDGAISGISSLFSKDSETNSSSDKLTSAVNAIGENQQIPFLAAQPYIEIRGIHIVESLKNTVDIIQSGMTMVNDIWNSIGDLISGNSSFSDKFGKLNDKLKTAFIDTFLDPSQKLTQVYAVNTTKTADGKVLSKDTTNVEEVQDRYTASWGSILTSVFSDEYRMHSVAEKLIQQSITGKYTMMCKVPLINNSQPILQSTGQEGFKRGAIGYQLKSGNNNSDDVLKTLAADTLIDTNIGLSGLIKWIYDVNAQSYSINPVKTKFTIYNDTFEHFLTNYTFIIGFMATTKAVTDGFLVRAPYLYDIIIPGGMRYMLCRCTASITNVGNLRKLSAKPDEIAKLINSNLNVPLNGDIIEYIPDAYEVSLQFESVLPDLWNFIDAYINMKTQSDVKRIHMGQDISSTLCTFCKNLTKTNSADKPKDTTAVKNQQQSENKSKASEVKNETANTLSKLEKAIK